MAIDSVNGRLYWATTATVEVAYLNGDDRHTYFTVPLYSGRNIISLTLNFDLRKVMWFVKGYGRQDLYMADMLTLGSSATDMNVRLMGEFKDIKE